GVTQQTPAADRHIMTQKQRDARLQVLKGGYAAERVILGDIPTRAENDVKEANKIAPKVVPHFGMSERFGPVYYEHGAEHPFLGQRMATDGGASDATTHAIESETRKMLGQSLERAKHLIEQNREAFQSLVDHLLVDETIEKDG